MDDSESMLANLHALRDELANAELEIGAFSDQLSRIPKLATRVVARANSAHSGRSHGIGSLSQAIVFLGLRRVQTMLDAEAAILEAGLRPRRAA